MTESDYPPPIPKTSRPVFIKDTRRLAATPIRVAGCWNWPDNQIDNSPKGQKLVQADLWFRTTGFILSANPTAVSETCRLSWAPKLWLTHRRPFEPRVH